MKTTSILAAILLSGALTVTSCKHDYICKCTTTIGTVETSVNHDLENQYHHDAEQACQRFEDDASTTTPGTTNCHI